MSSRRRLVVLGVAVACLAVVVVLAWMVSWDRSPLDAIDHGGKSAEDFSDDHALLTSFLRLVEVSFATIVMIVWTTIVAMVMLNRRQPRAAAWVVAVMMTTSMSTTFLKGLLARGRPNWQETTPIYSPASPSRPDTHRQPPRWRGS